MGTICEKVHCELVQFLHVMDRMGDPPVIHGRVTHSVHHLQELHEFAVHLFANRAH